MLTTHTQAFLTYIKRRKAESTYIAYEKVLRRFESYTPAESSTVSDIERYLERLISKGLSPRTINLHLACLKSFFRYLFDFHDLPNPVQKIQDILEAPPPRRNLTSTEYYQLLEACEGKIEGSLIKLLANTGIRIGELKTIVIADNRRIAYVIGKGQKQRAIPLNHTIQNVIAHPHFNLLKSQYTYRGLHQMIVRACLQANIRKCSPHDFRHYCANQLRKKGISTYQISKVLGHSSTRVTEAVYFEWQSEEVIGVTDVLDE